MKHWKNRLKFFAVFNLMVHKMENLNISIVQSELFWEDKEKNLQNFSVKISGIEKTDLIVLPEMFSTGFTMNSSACAEKMDGSTLKWMEKTAREKNCVITGSLIIEEDGKYFNRLIWMKPDGTFEHYDKKHLFRMAKEHEHYSAGRKKTIVELKGWKILPLICYDLRFPVWSRNRSIEGRPEYDVLIYIANWPKRRSHPWKTLLMARAIENLSYVIGVNRVGTDGNEVEYSGDSAITDFKGEYLVEGASGKEFIKNTSLSHQALLEFRNSFPAYMDADGFALT
jgi:omega-amidase